MRKKPKTILAIDPGLKELGYAVLRGDHLIASGVLDLKRCPKLRRLQRARQHLRQWIAAYQPSAVAIEKTYHHPLPWLDEVHGIARSARNLATRAGASIAMYSPQRVRLTVAGNGKATKAEVASAVAIRLPQTRVYLTQDRCWKVKYWHNMTDAIAIGLHHQSLKRPSRSR